MSSNFILSSQYQTTDKEKKRPCLKTIISLINYSKSIEIRKNKTFGKMLFINN